MVSCSPGVLVSGRLPDIGQIAVERLTPDCAELLTHVMDAVHNLPDLVMRWPSCNEGDRLAGLMRQTAQVTPEAHRGTPRNFGLQLTRHRLAQPAQLKP